MMPSKRPARIRLLKSWVAAAKRNQAVQLRAKAKIAAQHGNSRGARYRRLTANLLSLGKKRVVFRKAQRVFKAVENLHSLNSKLKTYMAVAGIAGFGMGHDVGSGNFSISTLSIAASLGLINHRMLKILGSERARRQLLAKLVGKPQIGKRLARLINDPQQREEILILSQTKFLAKEELQAIRKELTTGNGRISKANQETLAYGTILLRFFSKEPELVRTVLQRVTEEGESLPQARAFTVDFVKDFLETPQGYVVYNRYQGKKKFEIAAIKDDDGRLTILKRMLKD